MPASSHVLDPVRVSFDDDNAVADAGLLLSGTLVKRLGLERVADERVTRGYRPGRKLLTVVSTLLAGGDCIGDVDLLRAGATSKIVGHDTVAASTVGTWLRSLTFGHIRQLDAVTEAALTRAWQAGAGPGDLRSAGRWRASSEFLKGGLSWSGRRRGGCRAGRGAGAVGG